MKLSFVISLFFLLLFWVSDQQSTVFRYKIPPRKPGYHIASLAAFLRDPERMPVYIPIPLLEKSLVSVAETLARLGSHHYNPDLGLYGRSNTPTHTHTHTHTNTNTNAKAVPWVQEPTIFDLVTQFNAVAEPNDDDPIDLVAVCTAWEDPPRVYTRAQLGALKALRVDPCDARPWWCKQRCEFLPTVGSEPFEPPACAKPYEGLDEV